MCGIVGFLSNNHHFSNEALEERLNRMVASQTHRGPDNSGTYIDKKAGLYLGHNRLSIQDTSSHAHQPFISTCQEYIIIFNGEVYNFQDIRKELIALGYHFRSNSDTEVILYAYQAWGINAVDKFIGMFAFAIYDKPKQKLFLLRDRAGVKPLYYYHKADTFLFSSELKSFHEHPNFAKVINKEILPFYFQFAYIPSPYTIYQDCYKLQPAHYIEYDLNAKRFTIHKYWDIYDAYLMDKFDKSEEQIKKELEVLLLDSCHLRLVSDVPVGVFLSGGYDSSTVTSLLQNHQKEKLNTFTIGFQQKELNEANDAKKIAKLLNTNHTEAYCHEEEMLTLIEKLPFYYDEPFGDDSALPTILVSQLAKKEVTVALSADGGDEIFFGYSKYFALKKMVDLKKKSPIKHALLKLMVNRLNETFFSALNSILPKSKKQTNMVMKFKKFKNMINATTPKEMFIRASSKVEGDFLDTILVDGKFKAFDKTNFKEFNRLDNADIAEQMMAMDYKTFMVDDVLCKVDRATMSASLEGREPLLDHRLAEYMARIPADLKYKKNKGKYLLREILKQYIPTEITDKPKAGFTVPLKLWLQKELKKSAIDALESPVLKEDAIFKEKELQKIVNNLKRGKIENPTFIWLIMVYVAWREQWEGTLLS